MAGATRSFRTDSSIDETAPVAARTSEASRRYAVVTFCAVAVFTFFFVLTFGRDEWFLYDEWDFLTKRSGGSVGDLFRPHAEHWVTFPILTYRLLWTIFGVRTYLPYLAIVVVLHVTVAALLRVVMLRAGVGPWVATIATSLFLLFGSGAQDIVWAFQMGFVASIVFGLTHLLLADHDGPLDRRDWYGLAAGTAGMLCSGVALPMTVAVGVAVLVRRGWRYVLFHTLPLAALYAVWLVSIGRQGLGDAASSPGRVAAFAGRILTRTFVALGYGPVIGLLLAVVLIVGLLLVARDTDARRRLAAPTGLVLGAAVFAIVTAYGRALIPVVQSRYLHVTAAMVSPAIALAADAVVRRWRGSAVVVLALLAVGIPGNTLTLYRPLDRARPAERLFRRDVLATARLPAARLVAGATAPFRCEPDLPIGWLVANVRSGRIPGPGRVSAPEAARLSWRLKQAGRGGHRVACSALGRPRDHRGSAPRDGPATEHGCVDE
jgi:hypothetical protein